MSNMKKPLTAAALAGACVSLAHAQSSATLYGELDESLQFTNSEGSHGHTGSVLGLADGANNTMVWGIKGKEDLGGGLSAVFTLESQFELSNGANPFGSDLFGRQFMGRPLR